MSQKEAAIEAVKAIGLNQKDEVSVDWFTDDVRREMFFRRLNLLKVVTV